MTKSPKPDRAVSDLVGTMLLLGVTVTLVGVAAFTVINQPDPSASHTARVDLVPSGAQGRTTLTLMHGGGDPVDLGMLRLVVLVNGTKVFDAAPGPTGQVWRVGDAITVGPLSAPLPAGARIALTLVDAKHGVTLANADLALGLPAPLATANAFSLTPQVPGGVIVVEPPAEVLVQAAVSHEAGRKFVRYVYADLTPVAGPAFAALHDDGTDGDAVAGDGVFSGDMLVPLNVTSGTKVINITAVDFNGTSAMSNASLQLLRRDETSEEALNPTSTPATPTGPSPSCPAGNAAITSFRYLVNGARQFNDMTGNIRQGDHVKATITLAAGCTGIQVTLVSYTAPTPYFAWTNAYLQRPYQIATGTFNAGDSNLEVDVPTCYFQIDLVRGAAITQLGVNAAGQPDPNGNDFYSRQNRLLDADNGGTNACP